MIVPLRKQEQSEKGTWVQSMRKLKNGQSGICLRHISPLGIALPAFAQGFGAATPPSLFKLPTSLKLRRDKSARRPRLRSAAKAGCVPDFMRPITRHPFWSSSNRLSTTILKRPAIYPQSLFSAKARPDPDFRYFSNSKAFSSFEKAT